jgi:biotin carboxylase
MTGAFNVELIIDREGNIWILEIGPRNGGGHIPELIRYSTGIDLIKYTVDAALGLPLTGLTTTPSKGYWASFMVHSSETGIMKDIWLSERIKPKIVEQDIWVKPGDNIVKYLGANNILGTMILKFNSMAEMQEILDNMDHNIRFICYENS